MHVCVSRVLSLAHCKQGLTLSLQWHYGVNTWALDFPGITFIAKKRDYPERNSLLLNTWPQNGNVVCECVHAVSSGKFFPGSEKFDPLHQGEKKINVSFELQSMNPTHPLKRTVRKKWYWNLFIWQAFWGSYWILGMAQSDHAQCRKFPALTKLTLW